MIRYAYVLGVSARSVDDLVKAMGMTGVSKSQFLGCPIEDDRPYLWIDATYVKTREAGAIVSVAVIVALAVNTEGQR